MAISFGQLLTDCLVALGDINGSIWSREDVIFPWCLEALRSFPILRPMFYDYSDLAANVYEFTLPADFREVISVEYPIGQQPPAYCLRKRRTDPNFYDADNFYDVDHNYDKGEGWVMHISTLISAPAHVHVEYLANHDTESMADESDSFITVPDEYESLLVNQVICRAYRERLGNYMLDPTAHSSIIQQLTDMVMKMEQTYRQQVEDAQNRLVNSIVTSHKQVDKFDRVY
jgi:hypothetical protein